MKVDIISLFSSYFEGPFNESILKRAREKGIVDIRTVQLRDFSDLPHHKVDERPCGGGPGMVLMAPVVCRAIRACRQRVSGQKGVRAHVVLLSPQGKVLTAEKCRELALKEHLILVAGHYEGVDERVLASEIDEEISIGDYVLTNGALAAIVLVDAVMRFVPGVLGHEEAAREDSFEEGILDCPHYTKPLEFEGKRVPEILLSGDHGKIKKWRREEALRKTKENRPDLYDILKRGDGR